MRNSRHLIFMACALFWAGNVSSAELVKSSVLTQQCFSCHGTYGDTQSTIPRLNVISGESMYNKLLAYRSGAAPATMMQRIIKGYSNDELLEISRYLTAMH